MKYIHKKHSALGVLLLMGGILSLCSVTALFGAGRRNIRLPILVLILSLAGLPSFAQEARRLSPDEAVNLAIKSNLSLQSAQVSSGMKKRKADTAWNVFIPSADISATMSGLNYRPLPLGQPPQWSLTLPSLSITWQANIALFEEMKKAKLDYEGGLLSYEKAKSQIERDIRKAYYNMLLLQENIDLLRENLSAAERRLEMARASYGAGLASGLNVLQAQVAMENLKPSIDQAENGLKVSMAQFAMNLGLDYDAQLELIPMEEGFTFIPLDVKDLIASASGKKPDILELKQNLLLLESTRKATFYKIFTPSLTVNWSFRPTVWNNVDDWIDWERAWKNTQAGGLSFTLGFRLNGLLPFGSERQGLKDIDDNIRLTRIGLAQSVRGTEVEVYNIILNLEKARATIEAQTMTVDLAERTYRLTETAYRAGLQTLVEVQNAELELRKAKIGILEQNFTYLQGLIDLEYLTGVPFGTLSGRIQ